MAASTSKRYPPELRERAIWMVTEIAGDHASEWAAMNEVARLLGIGAAETVRTWVRQGEVDAGRRPGTTSDESAELNDCGARTPSSSAPTGFSKAAAFFASNAIVMGCLTGVRSFLCCPGLSALRLW